MRNPQAIIGTMEDQSSNHFSFFDLQSFESLFRQYYAMLCSYAMRFVSDRDTAEEIVQDLFFKIWEKRDTLQVRVSIKSYLFTAIHNRCLKFIEHRNVEAKFRTTYLRRESEMDHSQNEARDAEELQRFIDSTLNSLPERCRKIFHLSRFEALRYHEIAELLSISVKTVEANMGKALKAFRRNLKCYIENV
jgi:RNA polymerase sigma-70 factor (ECF subfamily)